MLVSLENMKSYLGINPTDTTYDTFLTQQINVVSEAIEGYCGRRFKESSYTQTFYCDEQASNSPDKLVLFHYPITSITSIVPEKTGLPLDASQYRIQKKYGFASKVDNGRKVAWFDDGSNNFIVVYSAGYAEVPYTIQQVVYNLVSEQYNKKTSGVSLDFGSDVQSVSIPGTFTITFDYTLQANDRTTKFGMIIGNYANVLDPWRSERPIIGAIEENYVE